VSDRIIELVNLTKRYGSFTAVNQLNLTIRKGEIFGLLGPNGAGKSTTILMMLGLTDPTSGLVNVCGINSTTHPVEVKRRVGYLPEDVGFYDNRTGFENLMYTARLNSIPDKEAEQKAEQLLIKVGLADALKKKAGKYSRGMRQRLGLADVLIKNPEVIILDEPTSGIDPKGVKEFLELIVEMSRDEDLTVLFASHNLHQVQQVCDRVGIFVNGNLLGEGTIDTLSQELFKNHPYIIEAGFSKNASDIPDGKEMNYTVDWLQGILKPIDGIKAITLNNKVFQIESSRDTTSEIARFIVQSGATLNYLNKKEYGLDDIYYQYFEGGDNHG
jgi:ABC-2 type transport system ATP-binding protein